ncbi:replication protein RepA [Nocardia sp. CA-128927]|uniref:replication protein RepA n=1 Tax=Nocardia sp. CA-128927 TaxID=3239975 RepID=UPI003D976E86
MSKNSCGRRSHARAIATAEGINYTTALRRLEQHHAPVAAAPFAAYAPRLLTDIGWWRRTPEPGETASRRNGGFSVFMYPGTSIHGGIDDARRLRLPHGLMARQVLIWICSEVIRTKDAELYPNDPDTGFFTTTGLAITGGPHGTAAALLEQIELLFETCVVIEDRNARHAGERQLTMVSEYEYSLKNPESAPEEMPYNRIRISDEFFEDIVADAVPIDWRVVTHPWGSLLTVDVYLWLAACSPAIRRDTQVDWLALWEQFEQSPYRGARAPKVLKFKDNLHRAADQINCVDRQPSIVQVGELPGCAQHQIIFVDYSAASGQYDVLGWQRFHGALHRPLDRSSRRASRSAGSRTKTSA